jgi:hypothetical protein
MDGRQLCRWKGLRPPQQIDVLRHFIQDTKVAVGFRDKPDVKRSNGCNVTLRLDEVSTCRCGGHV